MFVIFNINQYSTYLCKDYIFGLFLSVIFFSKTVFIFCHVYATCLHRETAPSKFGWQAQGVSSSRFHFSGQDTNLEREKQM